MRFEYLLFNLIVVVGPVLLSFDRRVRYWTKWPMSLAACLLTLPFYIIWDAAVTGRHWWFNPEFILGVTLFHLPLEEWLFFITVPFASLFIWEIIVYFRPPHTIKILAVVHKVLLLFLPGGLLLYLIGKEYSGLALGVFAVILILDELLQTRLTKDARILRFFAILTLAMLVFNGYLTARPVVLYDPKYQFDFRIITIPIEDFIYGFGHILFCAILYEKMKRASREKNRGRHWWWTRFTELRNSTGATRI